MKLLNYILSALFFIILQVFILNNIQLSGFINPFMYIIIVLILPFDMPKWMLLVLSFIVGIIIDIFSGTTGMHAAATVFLGFIRPFVLKALAPRDGYESAYSPGIKFFGINWFIKYVIVMTMLHHSFLFFTEIFKFSLFFYTLLRIILSTIFTSFLIVASQYFTYKR